MNSTDPPLSQAVNRRQFIRATAAPLAAFAVPGLSGLSRAASSAPSWPMRLAFSSVMLAELPIEEVCARAANLGFEAIDIWCPFDRCKHLADVVARLGPEGLRQLLEKHKLALASFTTYTTGKEAAGFPAYADFIGKFGGGVVVRESQYMRVKPGELTAAMRSFFEKLKPQIEQAAHAKVRLAIENHGDALLCTPDSFKAFVDLNPAPQHVGLGVAPYHLQNIRASVEEVIRTAGAQLLFFYAWQTGEGMNQLPGHGPADPVPWLKALAEVKYQGFVNPFMHGHPTPDELTTGIAKSCAYLKDCHTRATGLATGSAAAALPPVPLRATDGPVVALWQKTRNPNKPYIAQLFAPGEKPVPLLDDSPADHFHHHGLMFALNVEDTDFWTEKGIDNAGRQVVGETIAAPSGDGFTQSLRWLAANNTPLLDESRRVWVRATGKGADAVHWLDWETALTPAAGREAVRLSGAHYFGLGMRFAPAWANHGEFIWADAATSPAVGGEKVSPGDWCAVRGTINGRPVTVLMVAHPANPRPGEWFTMSKPFCYLSATLNLKNDPFTLALGKTWTLRYGIAVLSTPVDHTRLATMAAAWKSSNLSITPKP